MYEVSRDDVFSASHHLRDYHGKCEAVHGHNWKVRLSVEGRELGPGGMLVDFVVLKKVLAEVLDALDHKDLNVVPPFDVMEPTAENLARIAFSILDPLYRDSYGNHLHLERIRLYETPNCWADATRDDLA